ncbi:hypothetical protein WPS_14660 [Vulcanimicrobium alpinum]|uniref:Uncharacterized protein n=1 Tax=Vulcanimicrobium alpinum TaxID=3016050 RepID=A0AAN1XWC8_UNVUL|nr:hypothetical protein [Vulcanimicrobium alpinum]BDE06190.1 hypothetical protein WPS_14660 [Vulcanimicrobium alpinum]
MIRSKFLGGSAAAFASIAFVCAPARAAALTLKSATPSSEAQAKSNKMARVAKAAFGADAWTLLEKSVRTLG